MIDLIPVSSSGKRYISRGCKYFAGYDFMGGAVWVDSKRSAKAYPAAEAEQIAADLASSEAPDMQDAIELMNKQYLPGIKKLLDNQDKAGFTTLKVNHAELGLIRYLLDCYLDELHNEWAESTHEKLDPDAPLLDKAYDLAVTEKKQRMASKLSDKIARHYREE